MRVLIVKVLASSASGSRVSAAVAMTGCEETPRCRFLRFWGCRLGCYGAPLCATAVTLFISAWGLHVATYYYVTGQHHTEGAITDTVEEAIGYARIPTALLDACSVLTPTVFVALSIALGEAVLFTRAMLCHQYLALGKALLACVTLLPDAQGWDMCAKRLGPAAVSYLRVDVNPASPARDLLLNEALSVFFGRGYRIRWCADMMYSGHTYTTCLYSLALYELVHQRSANSHRFGSFFCALLGGALACLQGLQIYLILLDRFHYTMDVLVAALLTFLLYTNPAIKSVAEAWAIRSLGSAPPPVYYSAPPAQPLVFAACCFPFCCCIGDDRHLHVALQHDVETCSCAE